MVTAGTEGVLRANPAGSRPRNAGRHSSSAGTDPVIELPRRKTQRDRNFTLRASATLGTHSARGGFTFLAGIAVTLRMGDVT